MMSESVAAPLPWNCFNFQEPPRRLVRGMGLPTVEEGGATRVYSVDVDGRRVPFKLLRAQSSAPRPLLILLHGMGLGIATFRGVSGYLFHTHDLALVDYSNLGGDPATGDGAMDAGWPEGGVGIKILAEAVWRIADGLNAARVSLGGNSLGGALSLIAALRGLESGRGERLRCLVLSAPACFPQRLPKMYRLLRYPLLGELLMTITPAEKLIGGVEYVGYVDKNHFDPELRRRYLRIMSHRAHRFRLMDMIRHLPANEKDLTMAVHVGRLRELQRPVLITWGGQDRLLSEGAGERLAAALPQGVLEVNPQLAHLPHEEAPDAVGQRWAAFLREHG